MNVLVVDDSEAIGRMLVKVLEGAGHKVRWAATAEEALEAARAHKPKVVLLDLRLGETDGLDVARKLRRLPETKKARVIGLSGDPVPPARRRALDGFLLKPVDLPALLQAVRG